MSFIRTTGSFLLFTTQSAIAQIYNGGGPTAGVTATTGLAVPTTTDPRDVVTKILNAILSFMAVIAVAAIIVAGIYLIVGMGSDDSREKAKKIIFYTLIGLLIILFSRIIVGLVTVYIASQI
jgi:hypothetical protein